MEVQPFSMVFEVGLDCACSLAKSGDLGTNGGYLQPDNLKTRLDSILNDLVQFISGPAQLPCP